MRLTPEVIKLNERVYRVMRTRIDENVSQDYAYVLPYSKCVLPYMGEAKYEHIISPGIYTLPNGIIFCKRPRSKDDKSMYNSDRIITVTPDKIFEELADDIEVPSRIVTSSGDKFRPVIRMGDDIGMMAIKGDFQ